VGMSYPVQWSIPYTRCVRFKAKIRLRPLRGPRARDTKLTKEKEQEMMVDGNDVTKATERDRLRLQERKRSPKKRIFLFAPPRPLVRIRPVPSL
jgi:hypothetical protein